MRLLLVLFVLAVSATAADQVPFVAVFTSSVPSTVLPVCSGSHFVPIALAGKGHATHLGLFTENQSHCLDPATGQFAQGTFKFIGANGDSVSGTYSGTLVFTGPVTAEIYGFFSITGGTGRFAGASGGGAASGALDLTTGSSDNLLLRGTISRPNR